MIRENESIMLNEDRINYLIGHIEIAIAVIRDGEITNGIEILESLNEELEGLL